MPVSVPLDVVFAVIDALVLPTHPLAYEYDPSIRITLRSFALVCKATHAFSIRLLYSRVSIQSLDELNRVCHASTDNLPLICSLYVNLKGADRETRDALGPPNAFQNQERCRAIHGMTTSLLHLLQLARPSLRRLAISLPGHWDLKVGRGPGDVALAAVEAIKSEIFAGCMFELVELALFEAAPRWDCSGLELTKLRRLCTRCPMKYALGLPSMPALDSVCIPYYGFFPLDVIAATKKASVITTSRDYHAWLEQWANKTDPPIDLILLGKTDEGCGIDDRVGEIYDKIPDLVRTGLLWTADVEKFERIMTGGT